MMVTAAWQGGERLVTMERSVGDQPQEVDYPKRFGKFQTAGNRNCGGGLRQQRLPGTLIPLLCNP